MRCNAMQYIGIELLSSFFLCAWVWQSSINLVALNHFKYVFVPIQRQRFLLNCFKLSKLQFTFWEFNFFRSYFIAFWLSFINVILLILFNSQLQFNISSSYNLNWIFHYWIIIKWVAHQMCFIMCKLEIEKEILYFVNS